MAEKNKMQKKSPLMFNEQESNPERMLPAGHMSLVMRFAYLVIINFVVFGAIYFISRMFFSQSSNVSIMFAELVTLITLSVSFVFIIAKRNK
jgi:membrane protein YdbS with pleckstrin-like domain